MFFKLIILTAFTMAVWVTYRLTALSKMKWHTKSFILFGTVFTLCVPLLIKDRGPFDGIIYTIAYYGLYFAFICFILFACLLAVRDVLWLVSTALARLFKKSFLTLPYTRETLNCTNMATFALAFFLSVAALHEGTKVPAVRSVTITSPKITQVMNIVVLSDLHLHRAVCSHKIKGIVDDTNALQPDIVVLPGDTIDDYESKIQPQLDELSNLKARHGIFVTDGNHEFYVGQPNTQKIFNRLGFTSLFNTGAPVDGNVFIAGIPDHKTAGRVGAQADIDKALTGSTNDMYRILLSHQPSIAQTAAEKGVDLQISGHTHGGQIFPFNFITAYVNHYLRGRYTVDDMYLYVSAGAGQWGPQMRLFAPAEIVLIRLQPEQMSFPQKAKEPASLPIYAPTPLQANPTYFPPVIHHYKGTR